MRRVIKRVIGGKRYDTEKAEWIGSYSKWAVGDFRHMTEDLYKKITGEYFLYGAGGPQSEYRTRTDYNSWSGGERIMPMTYDQAREWAEEHLSADEYEKNFGIIEEDETLETITLKMPRSTCEKLRRKASQEGRKYSEVCAAAIEEYIVEVN